MKSGSSRPDFGVELLLIKGRQSDWAAGGLGFPLLVGQEPQ
jgi:hypothetical protein